MDKQRSTVDELIWADDRKGLSGLWHFLSGSNPGDKLPQYDTKRSKNALRWLLIALAALMGIIALIATSGDYARPASALVADGSCPGGGVIEPGETINEISSRYGVNASRIIELNDIENADYIRAGDCLDLGLQTACNGHIVAKGETLTRIGSRYGISVNELVSLNAIPDPDRIETSQCLLLADTGTATVAPQPAAVVIAPEPEAVADPEVREAVDEIIEDLESTKAIVEDVVADVVDKIIADLPEAMTLEEVVDLNIEIQADVSQEIDRADLNDVVEEVHEEVPPLDEGQILAVPTEVEDAVEAAIVERVQEELESSIVGALEEQRDIDQALAYVNAMAVPDPGAVSMDQAWEWYRNGGGPKMDVTDVARMLRWAGFCTYGVEELVLATATVGGESGFRPYAIGDVDIQHPGDVSVGFGQIYWSPGNNFTSDNRRPELNINPRNNVQTMFGMYEWRMDKQGWNKRFADWYGHGPGVANYGAVARQAVTDIGGCE